VLTAKLHAFSYFSNQKQENVGKKAKKREEKTPEPLINRPMAGFLPKNT